ncbi:MAG TPA: hypothetical protein VNW54_11975 [Granulicella sp.]|nr:hypothetical protein [Granulicella sp.]
MEKFVPASEREEWLLAWQSELWHKHHLARRTQFAFPAPDLTTGLIRDALWLWGDGWRRTFQGTATLCLAVLLSLFVLAAAAGLVLNGSWQSLASSLADQFKRFLVEVPLILFVTLAISPRRHTDQSATSRKLYWLKRQLFLGAKTSLTLLLMFLLSADLCQPMHAATPNVADFLQIFSFTILALVGLRWALHDHGQRCKQCLRSLASPTPIGRPSHNLLEWSGSELICKQGHGALSIPEMETSWCESSEWVSQSPSWDRVAST